MKKLVAGGVLIVAAVLAWFLWTRHAHDTTVASDGSAMAMRGPYAHQDHTKAVPASVAGRVTNKTSGAGIPGAVVALTSGGALGGELGVGQPTVTTTTDATGAWNATQVAPGDYIVTAAAPGFLPAQTPKLGVASGEQKTGVVIALAPGGTLVKGLVSDIGGGPIEGARVTFRGDDRFDWDVADFIVLTGHDGTYQVSLADGSYAATASHDDYVKHEQSIEVAGKPVTADFVLTPGGGIRGQVIARDTNKPVPFALVHAAPQRGRFSDSGSPNATADAEGKFTVHSLRPGVIAIAAFGRGYASVAPTTVELGIGEQLENVRVLVDKAYTISGTVVTKGTKSGVAGIHLGAFAIAQGAQVIAPDPSDNQGRFAIDGVRPGNYMLFAFGENEVPNVGKQVNVVDKDVTGVELELEPGATLSGRVEPPQGATMSVEMAGPIGLTNIFEAVKTMMVHGDADPKSGEFTLHNVPAGAYKLIAKAKEGPVGKLPIMVTTADQKGLVVALEVRAAVSGKVVDTTGALIADARISTRRTDDAHDDNNGITMGNGPRGVKSAADGTFRVVGLDAGTYELKAQVEADGFDFDSFRPDKKSDKKKVEVTLALGDDKSGFTLIVEAHNGVIKGQVIGSDKQPATDAWVTAKRVPEREVTVKTDADGTDSSEWWSSTEPVLTGPDGKFVISKLRQGTYIVVADGPHGGSRAEKKDVKPGDTITIELAPLGTLSGHVTSNSAPVTSYTIDCNGASNADRTVAAADGAYSIEHLAPGKYSCSIQTDLGTAKDIVDVPPGAVTLDFKLVPWASVTGTVISLFDHKPVPNLIVVAGGMDNSAGMADVMTGGGPKTDATGRFVVPKVASGKSSVMVMDSTGGFKPLATKPFTATDGQRVDVGMIEVVPPRDGDAGTLGMVTEPTGVTDEKDLAKATSLTVDQIKPGGPAGTAGVQVGDLITSIDGRNVTDLGLVAAMNYLSSGTIGVGVTVQLGIDRAGAKSSISVTSVKW
jgi:Carboxypeptidase regulatory-like domain/PDZ domain